MENRTQVFISYKYHGKDDEVLPDYDMAKALFEELKIAGIRTFFSDFSVAQSGQSDYKRLIDERLDEAEMLIVVATSPAHCESNWVRYEWDSFYNDLLSERKKGELVSYLDADDIGAFPRTIRVLQVFQKKDDGLSKLVHFVKQYFHVSENDNSIYEPRKGSGYHYDNTYELGDEQKRLAIQAKVESGEDYSAISDLLPDTGKVYSVLDVGCSMGTVTFDVFGKFGNRVRVLGIDKFSGCTEKFNASCPENMCAETLNLEDDDWDKRLTERMEQHDIKQFDLIYCSLSLHHMSDSGSVLKKLWRYLATDGYVYVRTCDDALKLAYPDGDAVYEIIRMTAEVPYASDRYHGRKIYSMLYQARFQNIHIHSFLVDTGHRGMDERYALYYTAFVWRKNYFNNRLKAAKTQEEIDHALAQYNEVMKLLDQIENRFLDPSFYFGYYVTIAIAQKKDILCL